MLSLVDQWFDDCSDDIRVCCSSAVAKLSDKYGWKVRNGSCYTAYEIV